jgi:hypothetical protein
LPKWLNIAVGYGGDGMITGHPTSKEESDAVRIQHIDRYRQIYLSLDVDLSRIECKSPVLRSLLRFANILKFPFPAIEFRGDGTVHGHLIKF